jgi:hypothetical protein
MAYVEASHALLAYALTSVRQTQDRAQIFRGLDILCKLAAVADNVPMLERSPDECIEALVELICVNVTATEPINSSASGNNNSSNSSTSTSTTTLTSTARLPACVGAFFADLSDTEVRDMAIETIYALCSISEVIQLRFAAVPPCIKLLFKVIESSQISSLTSNTNTAKRSTQLLIWFAKMTVENGGKFKSLQTDMCLSACSNDLIAELVVNGAAPIFRPPPSASRDVPILDATPVSLGIC